MLKCYEINRIETEFCIGTMTIWEIYASREFRANKHDCAYFLKLCNFSLLAYGYKLNQHDI